MPQQLSCPNCRMVVTVFETVAAVRSPCPSCRTAMVLVEEEEAIVAEEDDLPRLRLVELGADAPLPRPTIVMPQGEPPQWKQRPVAQAWTTVAGGLDLHCLAVMVALLQPACMLFWHSALSVETKGAVPADMPIFFINLGVCILSGALTVAGRLCCTRVPLQTRARGWMILACVLPVLAALTAALTTFARALFPDVKEIERMVGIGCLIAVGFWLAGEWLFFIGLARMVRFVHRPELAFFCLGAALMATVVAGLWLVLKPTEMNLLLVESVAALLVPVYVFVLRKVRGAVVARTFE